MKAEHIILEIIKVEGLETSLGKCHPSDVIIASGGAKEIFFDLVGSENLLPEFIQNLCQESPTFVFVIRFSIVSTPEDVVFTSKLTSIPS